MSGLRTTLKLLPAALVLGCLVVGCARDQAPADSSVATESDSSSHPAATGGQDPRKIRAAKETTFLESPLKDDGTVDYVAALNQSAKKGVSPENNAAVLYWQAFGPAKIDEALREQFFQQLGIETPPLEGEYFIGLDEYLRREKSELAADQAYDELEQLRTQPWTAEDHPEIAAWLKANEKPFELFIAGSKRPSYYVPLVGDSLMSSVGPIASSGVREVVRGLPARAMLRLQTEGAEAAWQDLSTCLAISRHYAQQGHSTVELLVGIALGAITDESCRVLASYAEVPLDMQQRIDRELLNFGTFEVSASVDVFERCMMLEALVNLMLQSDSSAVGDFALLPGLARLRDPARPLDVNESLRVANGYFDRMERIKSIKDFTSQAAAYAQLDEESRNRVGSTDPIDLFGDSPKHVELVISGTTPKERGARAGAMLFNLLAGPRDAVTTACRRGNDGWQLTRLTFAAAAYRTENGHYPNALADLVPEYVATLDRSQFTGADYFYRRLDPSFVLASVAPHQTIGVPRYAADIGLAFDRRAADEAQQQLAAAGFEFEYASVFSGRAKVTDDEVRLLAMVPTLKSITIDASGVSDEGLKPLAILPRLDSLSLYSTERITPAGFKHLESLQRVKSLSLGHPNVTDAATRSISKLSRLRYLSLSISNVTDEGLSHLAALEGLTSLDLSESNVTDRGLAQIARLSGLQSLYLDGTAITDEGLKQLTQLKNLTLLSIQETDITAAASKHFQDALPDCEVIHGQVP